MFCRSTVLLVRKAVEWNRDLESIRLWHLSFGYQEDGMRVLVDLMCSLYLDHRSPAVKHVVVPKSPMCRARTR